MSKTSKEQTTHLWLNLGNAPYFTEQRHLTYSEINKNVNKSN